tara:strand:+ start:6681 stop:6977 length:297 start_codon:yes stop_codon:yes gene_type:complete
MSEDDDLIGGEDISDDSRSNSGNVAANHLRSFVERVERIEVDQAALAEDKKEVYAEAKGAGFDTKALRKIVSERKANADDLAEFESILDLYRHALGMI